MDGYNLGFILRFAINCKFQNVFVFCKVCEWFFFFVSLRNFPLFPCALPLYVPLFGKTRVRCVQSVKGVCIVLLHTLIVITICEVCMLSICNKNRYISEPFFFLFFFFFYVSCCVSFCDFYFFFFCIPAKNQKLLTFNTNTLIRVHLLPRHLWKSETWHIFSSREIAFFFFFWNMCADRKKTKVKKK